MTKFEYISELMKLYESSYKLMEYWYEGSRLLFHEVMETNDISCCVIAYSYNGNSQSGRYVIPFKGDFFVMNVVSDHNGCITWEMENE